MAVNDSKVMASLLRVVHEIELATIPGKAFTQSVPTSVPTTAVPTVTQSQGSNSGGFGKTVLLILAFMVFLLSILCLVLLVFMRCLSCTLGPCKKTDELDLHRTELNSEDIELQMCRIPEATTSTNQRQTSLQRSLPSAKATIIQGAPLVTLESTNVVEMTENISDPDPHDPVAEDLKKSSTDDIHVYVELQVHEPEMQPKE
jgi:hypothetical protein